MVNMSPSDLMDQITAGTPPVILDVRSRQEFAEGHIPGAIHVPFWRVAAGSGKLFAFRDSRIVVYCGHGPRAYIAGSALRRRGLRALRISPAT
jgi:rhodanese-related sulfurtransferase